MSSAQPRKRLKALSKSRTRTSVCNWYFSSVVRGDIYPQAFRIPQLVGQLQK